MSSLHWLKVCFLTNVAGRNSALTWGQRGKERLLAQDVKATASKRWGKSFKILHRYGPSYIGEVPEKLWEAPLWKDVKIKKDLQPRCGVRPTKSHL